VTGPITALVVALAGGLGAMGRFVLDAVVSRRFGRVVPIGTMTVNAIGSFVLGLVAGLVLHHSVPLRYESVIGVGFCGGLTTFSTASFETVRLLREGFPRAALIAAIGGVSISCIAGALGLGFALL
jgi:CrcB protein